MQQNISFGREVASVLLKVTAVLLTIVLIIGGIVVFSYGISSVSDGTCNIAVFPLEGEIMPFGHGTDYPSFTVTPRDVRDFLKTVHDDPTGNIKGVLFEINSPGGAAVAALDISKQIKDLDLPNAALIGDVGASGGYMVASAADRIFASTMSDVGSIGVTMSYVENSLKNKKDGLTYVPLTTGKFKDAGSPEKPLSEDDRTYFQAQLDTVYNEFIKLVSENRGLSIEDVKAIADGSTLIGQQAVDKKLIDQIGDRDSVRDYFALTLNLSKDKVQFCEFNPTLLNSL
jgi:protease IV